VRFYGYRYYAPQLGRWLNRDPIGEEGGIHRYIYLKNNGIDKVDVLGLIIYDRLDSPADPSKCRKIRNAFAISAHGLNLRLWQNWLTGGGAMTISMGEMDPGGVVRRSIFSDALDAGLNLAAALPCGGSGTTSHNLAKPDYTNYHNWLTWMIFGYRLWYECDVSYGKTCIPLLPCCIKSATATCAFHALDTTAFTPGQRFSLMGRSGYLDIADELVNECFMGSGAKDAEVTAESTESKSKIRFCIR
jgi:hypothetical protein